MPVCDELYFDEEVQTEFFDSIFASLARSDQRRKGVEYIRGLLQASGRKSIRNISGALEGSAPDQSLHHFVNDSTWGWEQVRHALARYLVQRSPIEAWVVRSMLVSKAGQHSVGVERRFVPTEGRVLNAQHALGVWATSDRLNSPVNWGLHLPRVWLDDATRRRRASIPDNVLPLTLGAHVVGIVDEIVDKWSLPIRPAVVDVGEMDIVTVADGLRRLGIPMLVRIDDWAVMTVADPALTGYSDTRPMSPQQIMSAAKGMMRPIRWIDSGDGEVRISRAATVRVRLSGGSRESGRRSGRELMLLGVGLDDEQGLHQIWLTDMDGARLSDLLRLTSLLERVEENTVEIGERVGIKDYAGRSFGGWHRHLTLASAAHAVAAMAGTGCHLIDMGDTTRSRPTLRAVEAVVDRLPDSAVG